MKPIKIKISAFGPYASEMPEIRFDQFEDKGPFLITGDTGAGKTTIFDAICYALYGETSGSYRDNKNLRSEYASPETESYVDFYFSHQGKNYHVKRTPAYERAKLRGEGTVEQKEKAEFQEEGKPPIEGIRQVNEAVTNLLCIDRNQFKQIVMIAQGEFREMLNSHTEKRTGILRSIFLTDSYNEIGKKLKDRMDASIAEREKTKDSVLHYFGEVTAPDDAIGETASEVDSEPDSEMKKDSDSEPDSEMEPGLKEELDQLQENAAETKSTWNIDDLIDITKRIIIADEKAAESVKDRLKALEEELDNCKRKIAIAKANNDSIKKVENLKKEKEELEKKKEEIEKLRLAVPRQKKATHLVAPAYDNWIAKTEENREAKTVICQGKELMKKLEKTAEDRAADLKIAQSKEKEAEDLKKSSEKILEDKEKYLKRDELKEEIRLLEKQQEVLKEDQKSIEEREKDLKARIEQHKTIIEELKDRPKKLTDLRVSENEIAALITDLEKITVERADDWQQHKKLLEEKQRTYETEREKYDKALNEMITAEKLYENSKAGLLAAKLKEGEKCPVCGSIHHPQPAKLSEDSITEEDLNKLKDTEESSRKTKDESFADAEKEKTTLEGIEKIIREQAASAFAHSLIGGENLADDTAGVIDQARAHLKTIRQKSDEIKGARETTEKECSRLEEARQLLDDAQGKEEESLEKEKKQTDEQLQKIHVDMTRARTSLEENKELGFENWEAAEKEMKTRSDESEKLFKAIEDAKEAKQSADTAVAEKGAEIKTLKESLEKNTKEEQRMEEQVSSLISESGFSGEEEFKEFRVPDDVIAANEKMINQYDTDIEVNIKQLVQAEKEAEGLELIDEDNLMILADRQQKKVNAVREAAGDIDMRIRVNTEKRDSIEELKPKLKKAEGESETLRRLYVLVTGQAKNVKITLEQYVQATGFDKIIKAANRRLRPISDGQFELFRREDPMSRRSNRFLDLEVLDHYTGHRRPVGNLSGGESFKASLSLALGLSDTVSSNMGGVQMDALFIDEGFGSLDQKSIVNAMDILHNLSGTSKLVGIISHREELKESIKQQIIVTKAKDGSTVEIDCGA